MVSCQRAAFAYRSTVLRPQPRCRAIARREWPWARSSWTRVCAAFFRSARRPTGAESSCGRPGSGRVAPGGVPVGDGLRRHSRWAATQVSTARPRPRHRWNRSATCRASGAPRRAPSAYALARSRQMIFTPGCWISQGPVDRLRGSGAHRPRDGLRRWSRRWSRSGRDGSRSRRLPAPVAC